MLNSSNSPSEYNVLSFGIVQFINFLKEYNIIATTIAAILTKRINNVTNVIVDNVVTPVINMDINNDGMEDLRQIEDLQIDIYGIKFAYGIILLSVIKFIFIICIVYFISRTIKKFEMS